MGAMACDLSIIITAHNEGVIAHKTMLSVMRSVQGLNEDIRYEIIVHIDNGTEETVRYFERYDNRGDIRIIHNSFGDLSRSRTAAIQAARGTYIALADADDLYSENWLPAFYECVAGTKDVVARFQYVLTFGGPRVIITDCTDMSEQDEFLYAFDSNIYGSPCMFHRSIYEQIPQRENKPPFGYEDWQWFLDTSARGVRHCIIPDTVLFYRRDPLAKPSLLAGQVRYRAVLSRTIFFDFTVLKERLLRWPIATLRQLLVPQPPVVPREPLTPGRMLKKSIYYTLSYANKFSAYKALRRKVKGCDRPEPIYLPEIPEALLSEWRAMNSIERQLYPDEYVLQHLEFYRPNKRIAVGYLSMINALRRRPNTVMFVPWLNPGGADKVFINTMNELARQRPEWHIALMQTERSDSPWRRKLNEGIDFVNLDEEFVDIDYERQMDIMAAFIVQNSVERIIIANSMFGYHFAMRYRTLIKELNLTVYVYSFTGVMSEYGRVGGFAHEQLPLIYDLVYKAITDNSAISREMMHDHGYNDDKYQVHYQFVQEALLPPKPAKDKESLRILWASRVARQKMPEVLAAIHQQVKGRHVIDMYGKLEEKYDTAFIAKHGLNYIRPFNGIDDIPTSDYDVFIYTANADGLPNMLLEMAVKGITIIAPNVGGISDFIRDNETGILIDDYEDDAAYVRAIDRLRDGALRHRLAIGAQEVLQTEFGVERWRKNIKRVFDR